MTSASPSVFQADGLPPGRRIRLARQALGMNRPDFAAAIGISASRLRMVEADTSELRSSELVRLSALTGQDIEFFVGDSSDPGAEGTTVSDPGGEVKQPN